MEGLPLAPGLPGLPAIPKTNVKIKGLLVQKTKTNNTSELKNEREKRFMQPFIAHTW